VISQYLEEEEAGVTAEVVEDEAGDPIFLV
jgi:hypothetical protein